ncbi:DDB1- and CUL4-associated factor 17-like [Lingula anatina]|uniref:DDB1- and CUL4-associated factor 17-like n=1 Tax=Lingula anatina TaxID=7574 RepID=A0A1S3HDL1_LINAN|nr:DDB1- and CUL4-associated factor 17-like [Lingula anatina]|eukprot:XP_013383601.1 DDB1- and CUL4-associated factor 17-like [Lingula anatina]
MNGVPMQLYKLPHCTSAQKIEEGIICQSTLEELCVEHKGCKPAFLALTADNWLVRHDLETGHKLQEVFLSNKYKFRHLSWESDLYTIVLRSTHSKLASVARQAGFTHSPLMSLAVFTVFPLNIVAVMEVSKQVFGHDVTDAMISQGLLVVMHQGGGVRLYSFETVLLEGKQFNLSLQSTHPGGRGKTGSYPDGIPCNVNLKEAPPVLFHVRCSEHNLQLGGIPWHYMLCPQGQRGFFHVYSLDKQHLAEEGILDMEILSVEPDKAFFHPDDSGRIVHVGPNQLR